MIVTNPPFGGEEEDSIKRGFPADKQTKETALLFLQLIMRKLRKQPKIGRAAVVVPNGVLFGDGVAAKIKEELLNNFNLHTIVRLPSGVFAPYTDIPTNLLFFDRSGPTEVIWYYDHPLPEGKKKYSKTAPLQASEFLPIVTWWDKRVENQQAWKVNADLMRRERLNLDRKNPNALTDLEHQPPTEICRHLLEVELRIVEVLSQLTANDESQAGIATQ